MQGTSWSRGWIVGAGACFLLSCALLSCSSTGGKTKVNGGSGGGSLPGGGGTSSGGAPGGGTGGVVASDGGSIDGPVDVPGAAGTNGGGGNGSGGNGGGGNGAGGNGAAGSGFGGAGAIADGGAADVMHIPIATAKLDVVFLIDDSSSMTPQQQRLVDQMPTFLTALLSNPVTGAPADLHVGVISSSFGGGAWGNVNQCHNSEADPMTFGDDHGRFLQGAVGVNPSPCTMLDPGAKYLDTGDGMTTSPNFTGDIGQAFSCVAKIGDKGCGFESQFKAVAAALTKAALPASDDLENGGFLRPDARLAVIMLTNEDDCSVPRDSLLLDPGVNSVTDPTGLGALQSYRCNEFGHVCRDPNGGAAKVPPPHVVATPVTLSDCESAENNGKTDPNLFDPNGNPDPTMGHLFTVASFVATLKSLKVDPNDVFLAAIAGPPTPYQVIPQMNASAMGEIDPAIAHSCTRVLSATSGTYEYADPAVRINQAVQAFGQNGFFQSICEDFQPVLTALANAIHGI